MHWFFDTLTGLYELLRMAARSRFRVRAPYWRWRYDTAFGSDPARRPPKTAQLRALIEYGAWVHRMRKRFGM